MQLVFKILNANAATMSQYKLFAVGAVEGDARTHIGSTSFKQFTSRLPNHRASSLQHQPIRVRDVSDWRSATARMRGWIFKSTWRVCGLRIGPVCTRCLWSHCPSSFQTPVRVKQTSSAPISSSLPHTPDDHRDAGTSDTRIDHAIASVHAYSSSARAPSRRYCVWCSCICLARSWSERSGMPLLINPRGTTRASSSNPCTARISSAAASKSK